MTKHTAGPWSLETVRTSVGVCHMIGPFPPRRDDGKPRYACLYADYPSDFNPSDTELLANARLIAAAPELLEFAQWIASRLHDDSPEGIKARAAIAKATVKNS